MVGPCDGRGARDTPHVDINGVVSGILRDLAAVQRSPQSRWGYKRAAAAVRRLERPLPELLDAGALPRIHGIGPASTRIILEVLHYGFSPAVERAIAESGQQEEIARGGLFEHVS